MLSAGWLRAFGKYSYCMYLIHLPVSRVVREFVVDARGVPGDRSAMPGWRSSGFYVLATAPTFASGVAVVALLRGADPEAEIAIPVLIACPGSVCTGQPRHEAQRQKILSVFLKKESSSL